MKKVLSDFIQKRFKLLSIITLSSLGILFVILFALSLKSDLFFDQAFILYVAYLINEHDFIPYKDLFEFNMPISYLFHMAIGEFLGYSASAFRITHVIWLSAFMSITWFMMKPMGKRVALASCLVFGVLYLNYGTELILQRDVIGLFPVALALLVVVRLKKREKLAFFLIGICMALAVLTKTYLGIGLPAFVLYMSVDRPILRHTFIPLLKRLFTGGLFSLFGFILPIAITVFWLWKLEALSPLLEMNTNYVPHYLKLGQSDLNTFSGRIAHLLKTVFDSFFHIRFFHVSQKGVELFGTLSGVGIGFLLFSSFNKRKYIVLLFTMVCLHVVTVMLTGKFWPYHWMPFKYFASLCIGLVFASPQFIDSEKISLKKKKYLMILKTFACLLLLLKSAQIYKALITETTPPQLILKNAYYTGVEEVETYLNEHANSDDQVQVLDWIAGGVVHGMLNAKVVTATPYITDFQFYFPASDPYIVSLKKDFMRKLQAAKPRFIIDSPVMKIFKGKDIDYNILELETFLKENYTLDYEGSRGLKIYKRID